VYHFPEVTTTTAPGLSGIREEDINCRRTKGIEIEGMESKYPRENMTKEIIEMINYEDWAKAKGIK
jgi:hypothetical protein